MKHDPNRSYNHPRNRLRYIHHDRNALFGTETMNAIIDQKMQDASCNMHIPKKKRPPFHEEMALEHQKMLDRQWGGGNALNSPSED